MMLFRRILLLAWLLGLAPWSWGAPPASLNCSTTQNGKAVVNEVNSNADFVEIYLLQSANILNWALYVDATKIKTLGTGACRVNGTTTLDNAGGVTTFAAGTFIYCANNMNPSNNEVLLVDKNTALASGDATVIDYLSYGTPSPNAKWTVPAACGTTYPGHGASNQDIARVPDGSGTLVDNDDDSTPGASNSGITALSKAVDNAAPAVGQNVVFTVSVTAGSGGAASNVSVSDVLPAGLSYVSSTVTAGSYDAATGLWNIGTLGAGVTGTMTITATVAAAGVITNTASLYKNGIATGTSASVTITATVSSVSSFDAVEVGAAKATRIYTKLAGTAFNLDVLALDGSGSLSASYNGTPTLELVDAGAGTCAAMAAISGVTVTAATAWSGGRRTYTFTSAKAAANVRVRVSDGATVACSGDNFSIRPAAFAVAVTQSDGTALPDPVKAGLYDMKATLQVSVAGYAGTAAFYPSQTQDHHGNAVGGRGTLTKADAGNTAIMDPAAANALTMPVTSAAAGSALFRYHDTGTLNLAIRDRTFTSVDQSSDCVAESASNTLSGGKYGCDIGGDITVARFIPDHFTAGGTLSPACAAGGHTYMDDENLDISVQVLAQSYWNITTSLYADPCPVTGSCKVWLAAKDTAKGLVDLDRLQQASLPWTLAPAVLVSPANDPPFPAVPPYAATPPNTGVSAYKAYEGSWSAGRFALAASHAKFSRSSAPDGPYDQFKLVATVADPDDIRFSGGAYSADATAETKIRYGRLWLGNAIGRLGKSMSIPYQAQYWNGLAFVKNPADSCTTLAGAHLGTSPATTVTPTAITAGEGSLQLNCPASTSSIRIAAHLGAASSALHPCDTSWTASPTAAGLPHLRYKWCATTDDYDPEARASCGIPNKRPVIYLRENY